MTMAQMDWRDRAACLDEDPELFFPISEMGPGAEQVRRAKSVCARCPVRAECLNHAVENGLDFGVFGGTTAQERRRLPAGSRPEAAGEPGGFAEAS
ncbi:WhiB family transcriptional regulator [Saccharopolyspora sp. HNM0986]|uniref:WhiB family transcriptional regulator n=2 Tax=Pseudonocardiaceae TaxID=2070 RepID=UPI0035AE6769